MPALQIRCFSTNQPSSSSWSCTNWKYLRASSSRIRRSLLLSTRLKYTQTDYQTNHSLNALEIYRVSSQAKYSLIQIPVEKHLAIYGCDNDQRAFKIYNLMIDRRVKKYFNVTSKIFGKILCKTSRFNAVNITVRLGYYQR